MKEALFFAFLVFLFGNPIFLDRSSPPGLSPSTVTDTHAPASSAPDCRIQTC